MSFPKSLYSIKYDLETDQAVAQLVYVNIRAIWVNLQKEHTVGEAGKRVYLAIAIRESDVRTPFAHYRSS